METIPKFSERHPPMGSEKDIDHPVLYSHPLNEYSFYSQTYINDDAELDDLTLRVEAILSDKEEAAPCLKEKSNSEPTEFAENFSIHEDCDEVNSQTISSHDESVKESNEIIFNSNNSPLHTETSVISFMKNSSTNDTLLWLSKNIQYADSKFILIGNEDTKVKSLMKRELPALDGQIEDENIQDMQSDSYKDKSISPSQIIDSNTSTSSICSSKRLEWDNGADIGYNYVHFDDNERRNTSLHPEKITLPLCLQNLSVRSKNPFPVHMNSENHVDFSFYTDEFHNGSKIKMDSNAKVVSKLDENHVCSRKEHVYNGADVFDSEMNDSLSSTSVIGNEVKKEPNEKILQKSHENNNFSENEHVCTWADVFDSKVNDSLSYTSVIENEVERDSKENIITKSDENLINCIKQDEVHHICNWGDVLNEMHSTIWNDKSSESCQNQEMFFIQEYHAEKNIFELSNKYNILSGPVYVCSSELHANISDNLADSENLPHIRWYPLSSLENGADMKSTSTQTLNCSNVSSNSSFYQSTTTQDTVLPSNKETSPLILQRCDSDVQSNEYQEDVSAANLKYSQCGHKFPSQNYKDNSVDKNQRRDFLLAVTQVIDKAVAKIKCDISKKIEIYKCEADTTLSSCVCCTELIEIPPFRTAPATKSTVPLIVRHKKKITEAQPLSSDAKDKQLILKEQKNQEVEENNELHVFEDIIEERDFIDFLNILKKTGACDSNKKCFKIKKMEKLGSFEKQKILKSSHRHNVKLFTKNLSKHVCKGKVNFALHEKLF